MIRRDFKANDRGFITFVQLEDTYGADVRVVESSADPLDKVWLFIKGGALKLSDGSAHLNVKQAVEIRDALSRWIATQGKR